MGNTGIEQEQTGEADLVVALVGPEETQFVPENVLFAMFDALPLGAVVSVVAILLIITFFVTSSDSGSFVIDMIASGGDLDPPRGQRIFWAVSEGVVAAVLLGAGGLVALQAGSVSTGLPFTIVLLIVAVGLLKALRAEGTGMPLRELPDQPLAGAEADTAETPAPGEPGARTPTQTDANVPAGSPQQRTAG
jgi:choline/glycine/proline betaine transport protein